MWVSETERSNEKNKVYIAAYGQPWVKGRMQLGYPKVELEMQSQGYVQSPLLRVDTLLMCTAGDWQPYEGHLPARSHTPSIDPLDSTALLFVPLGGGGDTA